MSDLFTDGEREALSAELDRLAIAAQNTGRLDEDPIQFPHRFPAGPDREVAALFAACLAYGRADLIRRAMADVLDRMGPTPALSADLDSTDAARARFSGFTYRVTRGVDLARLWVGVGRLLGEHGSLMTAFQAGDPKNTATLREAMAIFRAAIWEKTPEFAPRRAFRHLVPDPAAGSACKRLNMFLRWMVRGPDAIDFGDWRPLGCHRLVMPLDTHTHRIGRYIGLTKRHQADWRTAVEMTEALRLFDPFDPVRFDFALAHMGISGACPARRVERICQGCGLRALCQLPS